MRLDVFEGPFDLLLRLIAERKLDVSEVDLAEITADFLGHLRMDDPDAPGGLASLDLETATQFLVVAATLIELKAARLLPTEERGALEDLLCEARDVLYAKLLEYRAFRQLAERLRVAWRDNERFVGRDVPLEERFRGLAPPAELGVGSEDLARIAAEALRPKPAPTVDVAHLHAVVITVRDAASRVLARLGRPGGSSTFRELVAGASRAELVVHFLALLELYKLGHVDLEQEAPSADLVVQRVEGGLSLEGMEDDVEPAGDDLSVASTR